MVAARIVLNARGFTAAGVTAGSAAAAAAVQSTVYEDAVGSDTVIAWLQSVREDKKSKSDCWCLNDYKFGIAVGLGAVVAAPIVLNATGFTAAGGVTAGSAAAAAAVQSTVYEEAVGSDTVIARLRSVREDKESKSDCWCLNDYKFGIAVGVGVVLTAPIVLNAAGFTAAGVTAGSAAAGVQSTVYGATVGAGSVFAGLQSAGAAGIGLMTNVGIGTTAGATATYLKKAFYPCNSECTSDSKE